MSIKGSVCLCLLEDNITAKPQSSKQVRSTLCMIDKNLTQNNRPIDIDIRAKALCKGKLQGVDIIDEFQMIIGLPQVKSQLKTLNSKNSNSVSLPSTIDSVNTLQTFYHDLHFSKISNPKDNRDKASKDSMYQMIGLATPHTCEEASYHDFCPSYKDGASIFNTLFSSISIGDQTYTADSILAYNNFCIQTVSHKGDEKLIVNLPKNIVLDTHTCVFHFKGTNVSKSLKQCIHNGSGFEFDTILTDGRHYLQTGLDMSQFYVSIYKSHYTSAKPTLQQSFVAIKPFKSKSSNVFNVFVLDLLELQASCSSLSSSSTSSKFDIILQRIVQGKNNNKSNTQTPQEMTLSLNGFPTTVDPTHLSINLSRLKTCELLLDKLLSEDATQQTFFAVIKIIDYPNYM